MTQLRTSMIIDLAGNLSGRANQFLGSLQRLGSGGSRAMQLMGRGAEAASRGLDKLGNRYTAMITGGGLAMQIKQVGDLSEKLTYIGIDAKLSAEGIDKLKQKLFQISQQKDIRVNPEEMLAGIKKIVSKTGDIGIAEMHMRNLGLAMRATGASGEDAGDMIANMWQKMGIKSDAEMKKAIAILHQGGKAGTFELRDMVTQGNRLFATFASETGHTGLQGIREMNAMMQVFAQSTGSAEEGSTALKNFFQDLREPSKQKILKSNGIKIFDEEALKKGKKQWRSPIDIIDDMLKKSKGDMSKLGTVFGMQTMDGMKAAIAGYNKTGINPMHDFLKIEGDPEELLSDAARAGREFNAALTNINTAVKQFAQTNLNKPIQQVADFLTGFGPEKTQAALTNIKLIGYALGGLIVISKALRFYNDVRTATGGGALGNLGKGGPIPVYVVNKSFPGGLPGGVPGAAGGAATAGRIGLAAGGAIALPLLTAAVARPIGEALAKDEASWSSTGRLQDLLSRQLVMGGGPQSFQAKTIVDELTKRGAQDVNGTIKIVIDQDGTARVKSLSSHGSNVQMNVDSGLTMRSH